MRVKPIAALAFATALSFGVAACSDNSSPDASGTSTETPVAGDEAGMAGAPDVATSDAHAAQFLTEAMKGDNSEVKLGKLAVAQAADPKVKKFGQTLVDDHSEGKNQAAQLAMSMKVPITDETNPEADAEYTKLQGLQGAEFDKEFASYMVEDHKKDIAKFQEEANSKDPDPVTDLAKNTIPVLTKHLEIAQSLQ